eukprot:8547472-Pyramimonas_sp.AAC.1
MLASGADSLRLRTEGAAAEQEGPSLSFSIFIKFSTNLRIQRELNSRVIRWLSKVLTVNSTVPVSSPSVSPVKHWWENQILSRVIRWLDK